MIPFVTRGWVSVFIFPLKLILTQISLEDLKNTAVELQDLVQAKVGATKFSQVYNTIRQGVVSVRRERKTARVLQVCACFPYVLK